MRRTRSGDQESGLTDNNGFRRPSDPDDLRVCEPVLLFLPQTLDSRPQTSSKDPVRVFYSLPSTDPGTRVRSPFMSGKREGDRERRFRSSVLMLLLVSCSRSHRRTVRVDECRRQEKRARTCHLLPPSLRGNYSLVLRLFSPSAQGERLT